LTAGGNSIPEFVDSSENVADFRKIRADILASLGRNEPKSILMIPVSEQDDGTPVAAGAATALAAAGYEVVLIDAQIARPNAHLVFGMNQGPGLAEALAHGSSLEPSSIQPVASGLGLIAAGEDENRSADLLASSALERLIGELTEARKWMIVAGGSPTLDGGMESIAPLVDAVILVAAHGKSRKADAIAIRNSLKDVSARALGVVMTGDG
jgi:Mrp family chromosome partitioning ATPase